MCLFYDQYKAFMKNLIYCWGQKILMRIQCYDHDKYWKKRNYVIASDGNLLIKFFFLYYIKKADARNCCSFGTNIGSGACFSSPPHLPHGPKGIIIGHDTRVGCGVVIFQHVTIAHGNVVIGNNVLLGAGSVVLPNVRIGNNVNVGANCVVIEDIPDNSTVVLQKPRIISHKV